jgi:hypothetical protein
MAGDGSHLRAVRLLPFAAAKHGRRLAAVSERDVASAPFPELPGRQSERSLPSGRGHVRTMRLLHFTAAPLPCHAAL